MFSLLLSVGVGLQGTSEGLEVVTTGLLCSEGDCEAGSTIGAEIRGVTNFTALSADEIATIRGALIDHKVVYFKGAAHLLSPATQLNFAMRFGHVLPGISKVPRYVERGVHQSTHSVRNSERTGADTTASINTMVEANRPENKVWMGEGMPERVARLVREPGDPFAFGEGYHADVTFHRNPPYFTFLVARELPGGEDDTYFIDVKRAYDELSPELKEQLVGLTAVHNDSAGIAHNHPVVRTHPETGERGLYVNSHFTHRILGYTDEAGHELLETLFDHIEAQPVFKFKWTCDVEACGTTCPSCMHVLMWDNRLLQHTATTEWARDPVLSTRRRELHRVTISGDEEPFFRSSPRQYGICADSRTPADTE